MHQLLSPFRPLRAVACSALLVLSVGCAEFEFAEQDLTFRYAEGDDRIELNVDTRGIFATPKGWGKSESEVVAAGKERIETMAGGARNFYLMTFPFIVDLESDWDEGDEDWLTKEQRGRLWNQIRENVSVKSARAYSDDAAEVALAQRVEIRNAKAWLAAINELVTLGVKHELEENAEDPIDPTKVYGTAASRGNLRAFVVEGRDWVSLDAEALVVRVPMTPYDLALSMKEFLAEAKVATESSGSKNSWTDRRNSAAGVGIFERLEELEVKDGVVSFRFPMDGNGRIHWSFRMPRHPDAKKFAAAFEAEELK
jgi:hypothetical protein